MGFELAGEVDFEKKGARLHGRGGFQKLDDWVLKFIPGWGGA